MASTVLLHLLVALAILPGGNAGGQSQSSANTRSPHGSLSVPCQNCHTLSGWKPIRAVPEFDHNTTKYPLRGMHQGVECTQCHIKPVFTNVGKLCADCHADIHKGQMGANCEQCHNVKGWNVAVQQINQHLNRFPLIGAHATLDCDSCHKSAAVGQFQGLSTACYSCHQKDFVDTKSIGIDHVKLGLSTTCESCHTMDNWMGAKFDHTVTGFALTGAHASLDCSACHAGGKFNLTSTSCLGCHMADFNKTNNPPHQQAGFPTTCEKCHNTSAWDPTTFDHNTFTKFPLTGAHTTVACNLCHINGQFVGTPTDCASCHIKDFNGTTNPNHVQGGFPTTCQQCHSTATWNSATFDHGSTGFPLTGAHTALQCTQCHNTSFSPQGAYNISTNTCVTCHLKDFQGASNPNHVQSGFSQTCQQCHTTTNWDGANFDHNSTGFQLTGAHVALQCTQCHNTQFSPSGAYSFSNANCITCHQTDYNGTNAPPHQSAGISTQCQQCHTTTNWGNGAFDHTTTGFQLTGVHTTLTCAQCHNTQFSPSGAYNFTNANCVTCHQNDYNGTTNPAHASSGISTQCQQCHNTTNWGNGTFDHTTTGFTLTGAHIALQCAQCHNTTISPAGAYALTNAQTTCISCHQTDYNGTNAPPHQSAGISTQCQQCHTTTNWNGANFDHNSTGFQLTGAHVALQCTQCHNTQFSPSGAYSFSNANCITCHQADYNGATTPPHQSAGISTQCQQCHTTTNWGNGTFDHTTTGFQLTGFHSTMACTGCHNTTISPAGAYALTNAQTTCITCHQTDYNGTNSPPHQSAGISTQCQQCHTTNNWGNGTFDHTTTGFQLTGFHSTMACTGCHNTTISPSGAYNITVTTCVSCHQTDYNNTNNPSHTQANFSTGCQQCHSTTNWTGATFNHATTGFTLTGAHTSLTCQQCHTTQFSPSGPYNFTSGACVTCHLADYNGTTNPNHQTSGFPQTCDQCHTTTNWSGATFNHASTGFTLSGTHATLACTQCHNTTFSPSGAYSFSNAACIQCHKTDYNGTNSPPHATVGFPTTCDSCHNFTNWQGATFNHNTTTFPLLGPHAAATVTCVMCHVNNNYTTLSTTCSGCHMTDYNNTTNPNHTSAGFPTTCDTCHTTWQTTNWLGATFNHTYFPTNHGNANGVCATCHTNPSDYSVFQCTGCHGGNNSANFHHPSVGGYVYNSVNCYQCHKSGGGG